MISQQFVSLHMFPQSKLLPIHPFYRDCIQDSPHQICSFLTFLLVHKILQYIETCLSQKLPREKGPCYHGQIIKDISWRGGGIVARTGFKMSIPHSIGPQLELQLANKNALLLSIHNTGQKVFW